MNKFLPELVSMDFRGTIVGEVEKCKKVFKRMSERVCCEYVLFTQFGTLTCTCIYVSFDLHSVVSELLVGSREGEEEEKGSFQKGQ